MSTGINCGQVRGPVQLSFARSVEPVMPIEITMTRMAAMSSAGPARRDSAGDDGRREHRGFGRKYIVPYGLYRAHGFVSAKLAERTGFSPGDLTVLWEAVINMFEHDRSAGRGQMAVRRLIVFRHASALGCAPAHALFDRVTVARTQASPLSGPPSDRDGEPPPARRFADYRVTVDREDLPTGVEAIELV
jgi:CRISPR-associated protein Csd2